MKKLAGWLILLAIFALMLWSIAAKHGWVVAVIIFVAALVAAGLVLLATWLISQE